MIYGRDGRGLFQAQSAFDRFAALCEFEPGTGCVLWRGSTGYGAGRVDAYGRFWYEGKNWLAHRWAAKFIHGFDIDGLTVDHCCPHRPDRLPHTLCVQHVRPETNAVNNALKLERRREVQNTTQHQFWLFVSKGIEEPPPNSEAANDEIPYFEPPEWFPKTYREPNFSLDVSVAPF